MFLDSAKPSISSKYVKNTFSGAILESWKFAVKTMNKLSNNGLATFEVQTVALNGKNH